MNKIGKFKEALIAILGVFFASIFPGIVLFFNNIGKVTLSESKNVFIILTVFGVFFLLIFWGVFKNISKAALLASLSMVVLLNFAIIERAIVRVLPSLYYWHIFLIILFVLVVTGSFIKTQLTVDAARKLSQGILIIFSILFAINITIAVPNINKVLQQTKNENEVGNPIEMQNSEESQIGSHPNMYFFIFDEYGGYENLIRYGDFDNTDFLTDLEELGFNVAMDARNKTTHTFIEVPNLLQLKEVNTVGMTDNK